MKAIHKFGVSSVVSDFALAHFLFLSGPLEIATEQAENLLNQAASLRVLPALWASVILWVCSKSHNINVKSLLGLWRQHCPTDKLVYGRPNDHVNTKLIESLLEVNDVDAVTLAAFLSPVRRDEKRRATSQLPASLYEHLINKLSGHITDTRLTEKVRMYCLQALHRQPMHFIELRLWQDPQLLQTVAGKDGWWLETICWRLRKIIEVEISVDQETLRKDLSVFVEKRQDFPRQIALAAMESLLRLDELTATPLQRHDWQAGVQS